MSVTELTIADLNITIKPGQIVKLGRFEDQSWEVGYGWYSCNGNRPICGWYLTNVLTREVKSLQYPDTFDIYIITS